MCRRSDEETLILNDGKRIDAVKLVNEAPTTTSPVFVPIEDGKNGILPRSQYH